MNRPLPHSAMNLFVSNARFRRPPHIQIINFRTLSSAATKNDCRVSYETTIATAKPQAAFCDFVSIIAILVTRKQLIGVWPSFEITWH